MPSTDLWGHSQPSVRLWEGLRGRDLTVYGGVYRPKGMDLSNPAFYVLPLITLFPVVTLLVEQRRRGR